MKKDQIMRSHAEREKLFAEAKGKNIVDVATSLGMGLVRQGRNYCWDQHDSFMIDTKKNFFYWNSQGFGGDPIKLVETIKECSFKEAVNFLTGTDIAAAKIDHSPQKPFSYFLKDHKTFSTGRKYLTEERLLSNETIDQFLSAGALAQATYRDFKTNKIQPVIVFKSMDQENRIKGMTVQGVWEQKGEERPYLKRTHGDGFSGFIMKVGQPPKANELSEERPLKVIAFEGPIDLMSYYELFKNTIDHAILVSMNGLRKGAISKCIVNQLGIEMKEADKPDFLDDLSKKSKPNKLIQIALAVDNDRAGKNFISDFGVQSFEVTPQVPALLEGETKSDWNQVLQRIKKPEEKIFNARINQAVTANREQKKPRINRKNHSFSSNEISKNRSDTMEPKQKEYMEAASECVSALNKVIEQKEFSPIENPTAEEPKTYVTKEEIDSILASHFSKIEALIGNYEKQIDELPEATTKEELEKKSNGFLTRIKEAFSEFNAVVKYLIADTTDDIRLSIKNGINQKFLNVSAKMQNLGAKIDKRFAIEEKVVRVDPRVAKQGAQSGEQEVEKVRNENSSKTNEFVGKIEKVVNAYIDWDKNAVGYYADIEFANLKEFYSNNKQNIELNEVTTPIIEVIERNIQTLKDFEPVEREYEMDGERVVEDNEYEGHFNIDVESVKEIYNQSISQKDINLTNNENAKEEETQNSSKSPERLFDFDHVAEAAFNKRAAEPEHNWQAHTKRFGTEDLDKAWEVFLKDAWGIKDDLSFVGSSELTETWEKEYYDFFYEGGKEAYDAMKKDGTPLQYTEAAVEKFQTLYDDHMVKAMQENLTNEVGVKEQPIHNEPAPAEEFTRPPSDEPLPHEQQSSRPKNKFEERVMKATELNKLIEKNVEKSTDKRAVNESPRMK